ncbi:MAG: EamA family transporter [Clostridia bacterium]|nr:EamA family transporter [Clostridia bacterium]
MQKKSVLSVVGAGVLWGIISLFIRPLSDAGLTSVRITAVRMIVGSVVLVVFTAARRRDKLRIRLRDLWMFVGTGVVSTAVFNFCYFYTIIHSEASVAVVLLYTSPVFILLLSALLFRERITRVKVASLVLTFAGCVCVAGLTGGVRLTAPVLLTGLGSGLFYGLYTIFGRCALQKYDPLTVTAYTFVLGLVGTLPFCRPVSLVRTVCTDARLALLSLGIGLCSTVLPYFLYTWGLEHMESGKAAILVAVEPLVGAVVGMTVFRESRSAVKLVGIVLILAAILLLNLPDKQKANKEEDG